ncbi:MAG: ferritin family protein [Candidatus Bathyarchaeota archaeon]
MSKPILKTALELALRMEEESIKIYVSAQEKALNPSSKEFLKELVKEEEDHKNKIQSALKDPEKLDDIGLPVNKIKDLRIVDYLEDVTLSPEADYQQILIYAGQREKKAHDLYIRLAKAFKGNQIRKLFIRLAEEELKHKYRIEREYDDIILKYM